MFKPHWFSQGLFSLASCAVFIILLAWEHFGCYKLRSAIFWFKKVFFGAFKILGWNSPPNSPLGAASALPFPRLTSSFYNSHEGRELIGWQQKGTHIYVLFWVAWLWLAFCHLQEWLWLVAMGAWQLERRPTERSTKYPGRSLLLLNEKNKLADGSWLKNRLAQTWGGPRWVRTKPYLRSDSVLGELCSTVRGRQWVRR